jgi:hypothetical protein
LAASKDAAHTLANRKGQPNGLLHFPFARNFSIKDCKLSITNCSRLAPTSTLLFLCHFFLDEIQFEREKKYRPAAG